MNILYSTVDDYIALQPDEYRANLELIRHTIKTTVPEALEVISYQMPAYKYLGILCFFAIFKDHYSLFVSPKVREAFIDRLKPYKLTKSAIQFPLNALIPVELIREIITFAAITNLEKASVKKSKGKK
jgi:uncharacterized protein YdhG (YjbR/CyaY superfamily)